MTQQEVSRRIGVARTTVRSWVQRDQGAAPTPRGRRPRHADRAERSAVLGALEQEGTGIGIPELQRLFPEIARRELEELRARRSYCLRRRRRWSMHALRWTTPGSVWAADFTNTPCLVDGEVGKLGLVRDLASYSQLLARPSSGEKAIEVVLALEHLFAEHGAPLVVKMDNGPGYVAEATRELCAAHAVLALYSPPYTPSYNGSCEAGGGSLKNRAARIAAAAGRAAAWTSGDVEAARLQANACVHVRGPRGPTPDALWEAREPIEAQERERFLAVYARCEADARRELEFGDTVALDRPRQAMIDRRAVPNALIELGYLEVRRR
ncbi:MAG: transposase family protein [bacterium]|nr:transposase family protein [bacterium]